MTYPDLFLTTHLACLAVGWVAGWLMRYAVQQWPRAPKPLSPEARRVLASRREGL